MAGILPESRDDTSRRAMIGGSAVLLAAVPGVLSGCGSERPKIPPARPDVAILAAAIAAEERLIALYEAVLGAHADLTRKVAPLLSHHRSHMSVLRRHYAPGTKTDTPSPTPRPAPPVTAPREAGQAIAALRKAERMAARARADEVRKAPPALAQLLASIGACEAGHVVTLTEM